MVTNVKMQVTPDLSQRIQEIAFANGITWINGDKKIMYTTSKYMYISKDKQMVHGTDEKIFTESHFKEISAYDFITSQGEQEWLPKYRELVEVSHDDKKWHKETFRYYAPNNLHPFYTAKAAYKFCRPIQKPKTQVITINGIDIEISSENFEALKQQICKG